MPTELVTSFSLGGAAQYGRRCVETVQAHWPHQLVVYTDVPMTFAGVQTRLTADLPEWKETHARLPWMRPDASKPTNYIWDAKRFAVKAFAWHDAAVRIDRGILVWLDGDTVTTRGVPDGLIDELMAGVDIAYLGRGSMHPENGFVAFRLPEALPLVAFCRAAYVSGGFRALSDGWTDCHVLRAGLNVLNVRARDLTSQAYAGEWRSGVDAFALSPLGPYVQHLKGSKRKREAA